jgi:ribosome-binding protein aMBF1 (putative translation factor)
MVRECEICGDEFETDDSEQDYCDDCNIQDEEDDYDEVDDAYDEYIRNGA